MSSQKKKQENKLRSTRRRKGLHLLLHHMPKDLDMIILQGVAVVVMIPDHHHGADLLHHEVVPHTSTEVALPIISLHIRVGLTQHTGAVDLVVTETVMDTEICHHRLEILVGILVIMIHQCVPVEVTGHHHLGAWNPHQLTTMTDMHPNHHHTATTGAHHPRLMDMHLLPKEEEGAVDIMVVDMAVMEVDMAVMEVDMAVMELEVVTEVAHLLHPHHIIILRGGTEQLNIFC